VRFFGLILEKVYKIQISFGELLLYVFLIVPLLIWITLRLRYKATQKRLWLEILNNKKYYGNVLAKAIKETNILDEEFIGQKDAEVLIGAMAQFPQTEEVRGTILFLKRYTELIEKNPAVLEDKEAIRTQVVIPIMRQFLYFLAIMDEEIRKMLEKTIGEAKDVDNIDLIIRPMLKNAVDIAVQWESKEVEVS